MASPGSVVIQFVAKADEARRDVVEFAKSLGKVDDATQDTDRELADLSRQAQDTARDMKTAGRKMGDGIADGARDIDRETGHIKTSMKEAGAESGAEFIGNLAEGIGSGTANVTEVVQGTLGGLTNLAASLGGPIGLAAGAAAAGVGLVFAEVSKQTQLAKEAVKEVSDALVDLGETSGKAARNVIWATWLEKMRDSPDVIDRIADGLRLAGLNQGQFEDAIRGSEGAQKKVLDKVAEQIRNIEDLRKKQGGLGYLDSQRLNALKEVNRQLGIGNDAIDDANDTLSDLEVLTGNTASDAKSWAQHQQDVYNQTHKIRQEYDKIQDKDVTITVKARGAAIGGGGGSLTPAGMSAGPATRAAPQPINIRIEGIQDPYAYARLTSRSQEQYARVQGRTTPGRRVSW